MSEPRTHSGHEPAGSWPARHGRALIAGSAVAVLTAATVGIAATTSSASATVRYPALDGQTGTVTAVSLTSITVKDAAGASETYAVTADTIVDAERAGLSSIKAGDTVRLATATAGGTTTATDIADATLLRTARPQAGGELRRPFVSPPGVFVYPRA